jgi:hypothetical protein
VCIIELSDRKQLPIAFLQTSLYKCTQWKNWICSCLISLSLSLSRNMRFQLCRFPLSPLRLSTLQLFSCCASDTRAAARPFLLFIVSENVLHQYFTSALCMHVHALHNMHLRCFDLCAVLPSWFEYFFMIKLILMHFGPDFVICLNLLFNSFLGIGFLHDSYSD